MLSAAHAGHLPALRAMIRAGAAVGSFDRELAADTPEVTLFFANLRQALVTGYFVEQDFQGNGHGRTMLTALLATPAGRLAWTVRVQRMGISSPAMTRLLNEQGYDIVRESRAQSWFLRKDAPPALVERMRGARIVTRAIAE